MVVLLTEYKLKGHMSTQAHKKFSTVGWKEYREKHLFSTGQSEEQPCIGASGLSWQNILVQCLEPEPFITHDNFNPHVITPQEIDQVLSSSVSHPPSQKALTCYPPLVPVEGFCR